MITFASLKKYLPVILITLLFSTGSNFLMIEVLKTEYKDETLKLSEWGDYVGGVYGTIISLLSLAFSIFASIYVYRTYKNQKDQSYVELVSGVILENLKSIKEKIKNLEYGAHKGYKALQYFNSSVNTPKAHWMEYYFKANADFIRASGDFNNYLIKFIYSLKLMIENEKRDLSDNDKIFLYSLILSEYNFDVFSDFLNGEVIVLNDLIDEIYTQSEPNINPDVSEYFELIDQNLKMIEYLNYVSKLTENSVKF